MNARSTLAPGDPDFDGGSARFNLRRFLRRSDWLFIRKEALVSLANGALSARDPTAPSALTDPGLVLVRGPDRPDL